MAGLPVLAPLQANDGDESPEEQLERYREMVRESGYGDMLLDSERNQVYYEALKEAIADCPRPDPVVLDIGTGTGILALMAAQLGAAVVYACEVFEPMQMLAEQMIRQNHMEDRVVLICDRSTDVDTSPAPLELTLDEFHQHAVVRTAWADALHFDFGSAGGQRTAIDNLSRSSSCGAIYAMPMSIRRPLPERNSSALLKLGPAPLELRLCHDNYTLEPLVGQDGLGCMCGWHATLGFHDIWLLNQAEYLRSCLQVALAQRAESRAAQGWLLPGSAGALAFLPLALAASTSLPVYAPHVWLTLPRLLHQVAQRYGVANGKKKSNNKNKSNKKKASNNTSAAASPAVP
ncbi:uncharacterized protein MONBRDRAFT_31276, partial [Monosiga brevicollis MX1]